VNRATGRPFLRSAPAVKEWQGIAIDTLKEQFNGLQIVHYPVSCTLIFYFDNKRRHDLDNAAGGVLDALTAAGIIEDDNVNFLDTITLQYGGLDKTNPRAEIFFDE